MPQPLRALERANAVKRGHIAVRSEVSLGALSVAEALTDPRSAGSFTVFRLLSSQRRWGPLKTRRFLYSVGVSEQRRVDALTERQRQLIGAALT
jgi:hypothetical protein